MLIDDIRKLGTMSTIKIPVDGILYEGHVSSKPINPRWFRTRVRDAIKVFRGKAIAVQYFDDLTEDQKRKYVKKEIGI